MKYLEDVLGAISNILGGSLIDNQVVGLLETNKVQGWWPAPSHGRPLSSDFWAKIMVQAVHETSAGRRPHSIIQRVAKSFNIPPKLIEDFMKAFNLHRAFKSGRLLPEKVSTAFNGSEQGKGSWTSGTSQDIAGKYKFDKSMGDKNDKSA